MSNWCSFTHSRQHLERKHLEGEKAVDPVLNHNYLKVVAVVIFMSPLLFLE